MALNFSTHELIMGSGPFTFGSWFTPGDSNWDDWTKPCPDDFWIDIDYDIDGDDQGSRRGHIRLTAADIRAAAQTIADGKASLNQQYTNAVTDALNSPNDADLDSIGADAVLQVAIYGDVIYG